MTKYTRSEIVSGLFVMIAIGVFVLLSFRIGAFDPFAAIRPKPVECVARFSDAKGLLAGGKVLVAGKEVGRVSGIRIVQATLTPEQVTALVDLFGRDALPNLEPGMSRQLVEVSFGITDAELRVDEDSARVSVKQDGFFGENFLALDPGYWSGQQRPIMARRPSGAVTIAARDAGGFDQILAQLSPVIRRVNDIFAKVDSELLSSENLDALSSTIESLDGAMGEIRAMMKSDSPEGVQQYVLTPLNRLLTNGDESLTALRERLLNETLTKAEKLLDEGVETADQVEAVAKNADELLTEVRPNVKSMIEDLTAAADTLQQRLDTLSADLQVTLSQARDMLTENRPEIAEAVRRLRRSMWEAEMALRKIRSNPALLVFGDKEPLLDEEPFDESDLRRGGRARPYNQRDEADDQR